jgi:hypothetical protein
MNRSILPIGVLAIAIAATSATALSREVFGVELPPVAGGIVDAYEQWLAAGGLRDSALLANGALSYWKHIFIILLVALSVYAMRISRSNMLGRAVFAWMSAWCLALLGSNLAALPPAFPNLVVWPIASIAAFFALQALCAAVGAQRTDDRAL